ncbi:Warthog protein 6 [Toxocara canis]|uniref:Warthog protein 6 n=1 Tax=Toxocara canis TaxID=6265 RepID=A0A0B2UPX0_TOXCA|nr:Warthog protein 6 [Toxocara canis]
MERASELRTVKVLRMGQVYAGGPVQVDGRITFFDLIKEITSTLSSNNELQYNLKIYRMSCDRNSSVPQNDAETVSAGSFEDLESLQHTEANRARGRDRRTTEGVYSKRSYHHRRMGPVYSGEHFYDNTYPLKRHYPPKTFDARRRPYYKPSVEDYDYYEMEPLSFRRALEKRVRYGARERFWPIANAIKGPYRMLNANKYIPFDGWSIDLKAGDETDYAKVDNDNKRIIIPKNQPSYYAATEVWDDENVERDKRRQASAPVIAQLPTSSSPLSSQTRSMVPVPRSPQAYAIVQRAAPLFGDQTGQYFGTPGNLNGVFDSLQCFSGDMTIETPDGIREIRSLKTGDKVLSIEGPFISYAPVIMFLHRVENETAEFNLITMEGNRQLKLTDFHLIYVTNCQFGEALHLVHSKNLRKGQCLHVIGNDKNFIERARIVNVTRIVQRGIYAPLTATGDIFVNSVLSSCHSNVIVQTLQQTFFALWRHLNSWFLFLTNVGADERTGQLPVGVEYITTVLNILMPVETFM